MLSVTKRADAVIEEVLYASTTVLEVTDPTRVARRNSPEITTASIV